MTMIYARWRIGYKAGAAEQAAPKVRLATHRAKPNYRTLT